MYLLDTNVISELRPGKRAQSPEVRTWASAQDFDALYLSSVTVLELRIGVQRKARVDGVQGRLLHVWMEALEQRFEGRILAFTARAARLCAPWHVPDPRSWRDSQIAATAKEHGFSLVTRNLVDFAGMGLQLVNPWTCAADVAP